MDIPLEFSGQPAVLSCPVCHGDFLHHHIVDLFEREQDEKTGLHISVSSGGVQVDSNMLHNPSRRRNGLRIEFWCETCNAKPRLDIVQHKGNTLVCWANGSELGRPYSPSGEASDV
jgi:hypothetical protein